MSANFERAAAFIRDLAEVVSRELQQAGGVPADQAAAIGMDCAQRACDEFAGQLVYIPMGLSIRIDERDEAMYAAYVANGRDAAAVAKQFDVSVQTAYKRIRIIETAAYNDRQGALFDIGA